jgi:hypothetical protein
MNNYSTTGPFCGAVRSITARAVIVAGKTTPAGDITSPAGYLLH